LPAWWWTISTYVAMYAYVFMYLAKQLSKEGEVLADAITKYMTTTEGLLTGLAIGAACTALGGFIAGRMAGKLEIKHGAFVGLGSLIVSFMSYRCSGRNNTDAGMVSLLWLWSHHRRALGGYASRNFLGLERRDRRSAAVGRAPS
jgi:hypothetical protein